VDLLSGDRPAARRDLDDVADPPPRPEESSRRHRHDRDDAVVPIEQDRVDRESHPERVHGAAPAQQQPPVRRERRAAEEAAPPLPPPLRFHDDQRAEP
jgi:hypothetical protein